ncbi:hypothetical protein [Wenjunlia tyrosinilytica]|uniref:Uncharacterized protein n=1 Tax=Wenjunlia tyrosinilytica TaxID=1544741 RepID=A0A917ZSL4_9ACTN|nr:hypothetical protein [Wenjunlia tyrosinilytica]GGO91467.1 hypothetical protein GCM10012280_39410 [Wenjunlia tyrosinilytica]
MIGSAEGAGPVRAHGTTADGAFGPHHLDRPRGSGTASAAADDPAVSLRADPVESPMDGHLVHHTGNQRSCGGFTGQGCTQRGTHSPKSS